MLFNDKFVGLLVILLLFMYNFAVKSRMALVD